MAVIALSLTDEHLESCGGATTAKETWQSVLEVFEHHTLLNKLSARGKFHTATIGRNESVWHGSGMPIPSNWHI